MTHRFHALVPCAGIGARAGGDGPKQYVAIGGRAMVDHTLAALAQVQRLASILVVLSPDDDRFESAVPVVDAKVHIARRGGDSRAATVTRGLAVLAEQGAHDDDWVLVHDAARCLIRPGWVDRLIDACADDGVGGLLALPIGDTLKRADGERVAQTVPRAGMWAAQTPQMFRLGLLRRALAHAGADVTDESGAVEALGLQPRLVPGDAENFKLTWPADFALAERVFAARRASGDSR
jgi:2-C-methyl-D-erythritol 4-phosphate cytidylyltransferase